MNKPDTFSLETRIIGPIPIINHFIERLCLDGILARHLTTANSQNISPGQSIGVLLRNIIIERIPLYGLNEWASRYRPGNLNLNSDQLASLNDDRVGRALDALFDVDRASILTEVVVRAIKEFDLDLSQIHNDSTSITFSGNYENANGYMKRGKESLKITLGHNKDHRPDLKQLMWFLTVTADGAVPIHYKACDGNITDSPTHKEIWDSIRILVGSSDFIYVADSKLCTGKNMKYIDSEHGWFITVPPRNRREDRWFRENIQTNRVPWEKVDLFQDQPDETQDDTWHMVESPMRSSEGFRIVWAWSDRKEEQDKQSRQSFIEKAVLKIEQLEARLHNPRTRLRSRDAIVEAADKALGEIAHRWVEYRITEEKESTFRQTKRGRPGPNTTYKRNVHKEFHVKWHLRKDNIEYDARSDGMFPLITNLEKLPLKEILEKYKYQPRLEKRHEQLKTVYNITPVSLKKVTRIEALLFVYFLSLLVQSLIEREIRMGMKKHRLKSIPVYPEDRDCDAPTTSRILDLFDNIEFHRLWSDRTLVKTFRTELSVKQQEVLTLLGVPLEKYYQET